MDDTRTMNSREGGSDADRDTVEGTVYERALFLHNFSQAGSVDVFDNQVRGAMAFIGVEYRSCAERWHLTSPGDLAAESRPELVHCRELGTDNLHGYDPAVRIASLIYRAHAALTEQPQ
ncbi:hypothetical protein KRM28CT15_52830 [Krasilnikovia sp. M28-CT-15]